MLKSITIANFKSLRYVSVDLDPVTVLIGRSGTGKSNFVDAIRLLRDMLLNWDAALNGFGGWSRVGCLTAEGQEPISFDVRFSVPKDVREYRYRLSIGRDVPQLRGEELSVDGSVLYALESGKWTQPPNLLPFDDHPNAPQLRRLTALAEVQDAFLTLARGIGCYRIRNDVLCGDARQGFGASRNSSADLDDGMSDDGSNYRAVYDALSRSHISKDSRKQLSASLRVLNESVSGLSKDMQSDELMVAHQINGKIVSLGLDRESEGFRRYLAHLLAIYQFPPKDLLVFDEPEQGIYPGALAALAGELRSCPDAGRGQVILTTHSPQFLDEFPVESLRVVELVGHETKISRIAESQRSAVVENLLSTGELLTVDEARSSDAMLTTP